MRAKIFGIALAGLLLLEACEGPDQSVEGQHQAITAGPWGDFLVAPDPGPAPYTALSPGVAPCEAWDGRYQAYHVGFFTPRAPGGDVVMNVCLFIDHTGHPATATTNYRVMQTPLSPYALQPATWTYLGVIVPPNVVKGTAGANEPGNPLCLRAGMWGEVFSGNCHSTWWDGETPRIVDPDAPWQFIVNPNE